MFDNYYRKLNEQGHGAGENKKNKNKFCKKQPSQLQCLTVCFVKGKKGGRQQRGEKKVKGETRDQDQINKTADW